MTLNKPGTIYQAFHGPICTQMPKLQSGGWTPITLRALVQHFLDVLPDGVEARQSWWHTDHRIGSPRFTTGGAVLYHPNGKIKVVPISEDLSHVTTHSYVERSKGGVGALLLPEGIYEATQGYELSCQELEKGREGMAKDDVISNPLWRAALENDIALLERFAETTTQRIRAIRDMCVSHERDMLGSYDRRGLMYADDEKIMRLSLYQKPERAVLCALGVIMQGSHGILLSCDSGMKDEYNRLIGIKSIADITKEA